MDANAENVDWYNRNKKLRVTINHPLLKSRQPIELGIVLNGETGRIVQQLIDDYCLIEFDNLFVTDEKKFFKVKGQKTPLLWYVHKEDLSRI